MCPFVDAAEPRCAAYLTMESLSRAFAYCAGGHARCPVFRALIAEQTRTRAHGQSPRQPPPRRIRAAG